MQTCLHEHQGDPGLHQGRSAPARRPHLDRAIAQKNLKLLRRLEVDLMATSKSSQVEVYFAALEDNKATALDAFTED